MDGPDCHGCDYIKRRPEKCNKKCKCKKEVPKICLTDEQILEIKLFFNATDVD
jgi:hypothetical protein